MKKLILLIIILMFLLPVDTKAVTLDEYNEALANVSISAATTYSNDFQYSYVWGGSQSNPVNMSSKLTEGLRTAFQGIKTKSGNIYGTSKADAGIKGSYANKFPVYCATFVKLMVYHASNGKVSFNYGDNDSYEKIKVSELRRGDIIDYPSHVAIYLDDANDNDPNTFRVAEASSKTQVRVINLKPDTGWRIKSSILNQLDYNVITASYDFHNRLDDYAPIITSVNEVENTNRINIIATDYKHYDLAERSDILEPESNGIVAYQVSKSSIIPTTDWKNTNKTDLLNIYEEVEGNGTYYVYVKDIGGNVSQRTVNLTKIYVDKELPTLGEFSYESMETSIKVTIMGATDNNGIKEYRYYLDNSLVNSSKDNSYIINNLLRNKSYSFYYEVVDNSNNTVKSEVFNIETEIDAKNIEVSEEKIYLVKGELYKLEPKIEIERSNYLIKYQSSNEQIATVSSTGEIKAISSGITNISIAVGRTRKSVIVKVSPQSIIFDLYDLPSSYIGKEYNEKIVTTPESIITVIDSTLPSGLYLSNNTIMGIPKENTVGEYEITFHAKYNNSEAIKKYTLFVKYNIEINNKKLNRAYLNKEYNEKIEVNYPANLSIINGSLPSGLSITNNVISGIPTSVGEYKFTVKADYMNSTCERDYTIVVSKYSIYSYLLIMGIIIAIIIFSMMIRNSLRMHNSVK